MTQRTSILCPDCNKLISSYIDECPHCGLKSPGQKSKIYKLFGANQRSFVKIIITVNVIFFAASFLVPLFFPFGGPLAERSLGFLPAPRSQSLALLGWADLRMLERGDWWVLITAMFLHGGILHIMFNMLWVRDLGPQTEVLFSPHKMLIIYVLSGIGGNVAAVYTPVVANSLMSLSLGNYPVVGASGAVFGLIGAIIAFGKKRGGFWGRQIVRQLGMWAAILIAMGFIFPGISNAGHIGGFVSGYIIGRLIPLQSAPSTNKIYVVLGTCILFLCGYSFFQMILRLIYVHSQL